MHDKSAPASQAGRRDTLAGKTIASRYVIERLIARGGMAAVYLAHQVQLKRKVAIKVLRPPPDTDDAGSFHDRFRLEAETLAQLNHTNIVTIYDHGDFDEDQVFLAMEYVDGQRLTDLLRDGPIPVERALDLLMQVCEALRYAHRRGVVHRDLKPSNLLITTNDDGADLVKVVDFGLVKLTEVDVTITSAGLILGSPHCMAPEQVRGHDVDTRTDIYAMGILLFRCLTGTYPFHGANSTATMIAHLNQPTPTFFSAAPDLEVPDGLENVTRRCLAKNPAERFQTMEELQDALAYFLNISPEQYRTVTRTHATLERYAPQLRKRTSPLLWVGLGLVGATALAVVTGAGLWAGTQLFATERPSGVDSATAPVQAEPDEPGEVVQDQPPPEQAGTPDGEPGAGDELSTEGDPADQAGDAGDEVVSDTEPVAKPKTAQAQPKTRPSRTSDKPTQAQPAAGTSTGAKGATSAAKSDPAADSDPPKVELGKDFANDMDNW